MALSCRSFEQSHLGLSGKNQIPMSWMNGIAACTATGIRHAAFVVYFTVPKTVQAAMIEPTYYFRIRTYYLLFVQ